MCQSVVKPIQNILVVMSEMYGVTVYTHYGCDKLRKKECKFTLHL